MTCVPRANPRVTRAILTVGIGVCVAAGTGQAQNTPDITAPDSTMTMRLAECGPTGESCLLIDGTAVMGTRAGIDRGSFFGRSPLTWLLIGRATPRSTRVLVLLDVSGSMRGQGIASARAAVSAFLRSLPADRTQVAVAPFESHGVAARIRAATFGKTADALQSLASLPPPAGNTGLYSAVLEGVRVLAANGAGYSQHVVVVTDGVNDVHPGDDAALLVGPQGLAAAIAAASAASVQVWTVGVGAAPDKQELSALAGAPARMQVVAADPLTLGRALRQVGERITSNTRLLVGTAAAPAIALGARPRRIRTIVRNDNGSWELNGTWAPPLLAPPVASAAFAEKGQTLEDGGAVGLTWWRWALLALPLGITLLVALPVIASLEVGPPAGPRAATVATGNAGLRDGVKEARPRTLGEVTASRAERIVRLADPG